MTMTMTTDRAEPCAVSPQQRMIWRELRKGAPCRAVALGMSDAAPDDEHLAAAAHALLRSHPLLRSRFTGTDAGLPAGATDGADMSALLSRLALPAEMELAWEALHGLDLGTVAQAVLYYGHSQLPDGRWLCAVAMPGMHADGASAAAVLETLYARPVIGADAIPYDDLALWWDDQLLDEERADGRRHWRALPVPIVPPLPAEREAAGVMESGTRVRRTLAEPACRRLQALCQALQIDSETWLLAVWGELLRRVVGGEADTVLPLWLRDGGRDMQELADTLGPVAKLLPVAMPVSTDAPFSRQLRVWQAALQQSRRWASDFEPAQVERLAPSAAGPACPLQFACYPQRPAGLDLARHADVLAAHRLRLSAWIGEAGWATVEIDADASFGHAYGARLLDQFMAALNATLDDPEVAANRLALLDDAAREEVLTRFNPAFTVRRDDEDVALRFAAQARSAPHRVAVEDETGAWTYAQLDHAVEALVRRMREAGVGLEDRVCICLERTRALPLAVLAALRAGVAYVPLDPALPPARMAAVLAQARPVLVLADAHTGALLPALACTVLMVDAAALEQEGAAAGPPATLQALAPQQAAYVMFTSGSTGAPKGVVVPRAALANFLVAVGLTHRLGEDDAVLGLTSLSFDIAGLELLLPLVEGARLVLASAASARDPEAIARLVERTGVTLMQATPATWQLLCESTWPKTDKPLRVLCGGEAMSASLARALLERVSEVWNMYGPTETTIWSTSHRLTAALSQPLIGRPLRNTSCHVLDAYLEPAPVGVTGELYIGGDGVARGYFDRPDLTAERFVPDLFGTPGARLYRTGDLARYRADGTLECLGRIDQQVKIRGFRVEPGEIEAALVRAPGVGQALVMLREDDPGAPKLVAYVTAREAPKGDQAGGPSFSVYFFGADGLNAEEGYSLYFSAAEFADEHGFEAVWTPERHFHPVGGLYPNPAVLNAALAGRTRRVHLRAGSVVLPLHSTLRVAEEWAVVDQISGGRAGLAIASGWHPRDFVLAPQRYAPAERFPAMLAGMRDLRALWRGEAIQLRDGAGNLVDVRSYPKPRQADIPLWITSAGNAQTIETAAAHGANLLTHLLGQTMETLADNVRLYRDALARHGFDPASRRVTLMVHTYLGETREEAVEAAREPFLEYMRSHIGLLESLVRSLGVEHRGLGAQDLENAVAFAFERYSRTASLIGSPEDAVHVVHQLHALGVDEIACLIDWMPAAQALAGLQRVPALREMAATRPMRLDADSLRSHCQRVLPDYMTPSAFLVLERFPLTVNGKVDRRALPAPQSAADAADAADGAPFEVPREGVEQILAEIWARVLRRPRVGRRDHFFHLGGDSILAIQVIARAREAGLRITPRELFLHPTLERLAAVAMVARPDTAEQGLVTGGLTLMPIQRWFFDLELPAPHHFNQSLVLAADDGIDVTLLAEAMDAVLAHHDALRLKFVRTDGAWQAEHAAPVGDTVVPAHDLSTLAEPARDARFAALADALQADARLEDGKLLRCAAVRWDQRAWRLLLVGHHLIVDGLSWRVIVEDLSSAYRQRVRGQAVALPLKTASLREWSERLGALAQDPGVLAELPHWEAACAAATRVPAAALDAGTVPEPIVHSVHLDVGTTAALVQQVPALFRTRIDDLLLTALSSVLAAWTGSTTVGFDLESHGREALFDDIDVSRTVGWFTSLYPVRIALGGETDPLRLLKSVKEQLRTIPRHGIGYGVLRYSAGAPSLAAGAANAVCFNYLGQIGAVFDEQALFAPATQPRGLERDAANRSPNPLEVNAVIIDGELHVSWSSQDSALDAATVAWLAASFMARLRGLVDACLASAGGYTPSDFPLAAVGQDWLDALHARDDAAGNAVEDLLALTPIQQGVLLHSLMHAGSGMYVQQMRSEYDGSLDVKVLQGALQAMLDRHAVLRGTVVWEGVQTPLMIVYRHVAVELVVHDWRMHDAAMVAMKRADFLAEDRALGFNEPGQLLQRFTLLRLSDATYELVWTCHYLLFDGWSFAELQRQFLADFAALAQGQALQAPPPRPFSDYVAWLALQDHGEAQRFWREQLSDIEQATPLMLDHRGQERHGHGVIELVIEPPETAQLAAFATSGGLTMNTVVQGVWALLLARLSQERTVVFGSTVSGRPAELPGVETMIGMFVNSLPVRVDIDDALPLREWLSALQQRLAEMRRFEAMPLTQIQACSGLPSGAPLFESLVVFENFPIDDVLKRGGHRLPIRSLSVQEQTNYPLTLTVTAGDKLALALSYDYARFDEQAGEAIMAMLRILFASLLTAAQLPQGRLGDLVLLDPAQESMLVREWNRTGRVDADGQTVHGLVQAQALRTPQAVALRCGEQTWSYQQLEHRSNRLAHELRSRGCGPGVRVGVCLPRTPDMVAALLAVMKSGAAYVPLDPAYPAERLALMAGDAQLKLVLCDAQWAQLAPPDCLELGCLVDATLAAERPATALPECARPYDLAYVIYTSGSTGRPKGVAIEHRSSVAMIHWVRESFTAQELGGMLASTSVCFDLSVFELFAPLSMGGTAVLVENALELPQLAQAVSFVNTVPSAMIELLRHGTLPASVTAVGLAGEPLTDSLVQRIFERSQVQAVYNLYGPSEDTTYSTWDVVRRGERREMTIGRPLTGTQAYVLDLCGRPLPVGVAGELYLGGQGLARGYLGRPDLTAERFVPDPFSEQAGARLYRTGDRVKWRADGRLAFLGRIDHQVKLRGYRIELGEVEAALRVQEGVQEALAMVRDEGEAGPRLLAWVVPKAGAVLAAADLKALLQRSLPGYMVPSAMAVLAAFPLTPTGKINRRALASPVLGATAPAAPESMTATQQQIAAIWRELLGVPQVGLHDNFFDLGGHSLLMLRTLGQLRELGGNAAGLDIVDLFTYPTVAALAQRLAADEQQAAHSAATAASRIQDSAARQRAAQQQQRNKHLKSKHASTT